MHRVLRNRIIAAVAVLAVTAAAFVATAEEEDKDVAIVAIDEFIQKQEVDKSKSGWKTSLNKPPQVEFDADTTYYWNLETNVGNIKVKLDPVVAPMHVSSTIYLTQLGFYDGIIFHRVIPGFMAQGGDPLGRGNGGPGYNYSGEFDAKARHNKGGLLSMANAGPGTDGSQFFITLGPATRLNGKHTIFGKLADGKPGLSKLGRAGTTRGKPKRKAYIKKATISVE